MGAAKKRKIEVRHYIIGIAVFVVAVAISLIIFFLASSRMIRDKSEDARRAALLSAGPGQLLLSAGGGYRDSQERRGVRR